MKVRSAKWGDRKKDREDSPFSISPLNSKARDETRTTQRPSDGYKCGIFFYFSDHRSWLCFNTDRVFSPRRRSSPRRRFIEWNRGARATHSSSSTRDRRFFSLPSPFSPSSGWQKAGRVQLPKGEDNENRLLSRSYKYSYILYRRRKKWNMFFFFSSHMKGRTVTRHLL